MASPKEQSNAPSSAETDKISSLLASANLQYSLKNYDAASELYSRATEIQAERNGDMAPENADILYLYGRCLYKVALAKSNVLGGTVAGPSDKPKKKSKADKAESSKAQAAAPAAEGSNALPSADDKLAEDIVEAAVENKEGMKTDPEEKPKDKPFFMITGDDNWDTDSEEEGEGDEGAEGEDAEEDDFANAYEILEIARVLLQRQIEGLQSEQGDASGTLNGDAKGKAPASADGDQIAQKVRAVKERLADTHDLLAEISLENERFLDAVPDSRASLELKKELHPPESSLIAEAHFKLSLALEFASVTKLREVAERQQEELRQKFHNGGESATITPNPTSDAVDEDLRSEAAREMEAAISSSKLRVSKEEAALASKTTPEEKKKAEQDIADVKEMIEEMEQRLADLQAPAIRIPTVVGTAGSTDEEPLGGILGAILGESTSEQKARIEEAKKGANDLTGLVRHKKKPAPAATEEAKAEPIGNANGKRKLEDDDENVADVKSNGKKVRIEDVPDEA